MCRNRPSAVQQKRTAREAAEVDLQAKRKEFVLNAPHFAQSLLLRLLNDPRDLPVAVLYLNIISLVVPSVVVLFWAPQSHILGAIYLATNYAVFLTRFLVALLHISEHRRLFKPGECIALLLRWC